MQRVAKASAAFSLPGLQAMRRAASCPVPVASGIDAGAWRPFSWSDESKAHFGLAVPTIWSVGPNQETSSAPVPLPFMINYCGRRPRVASGAWDEGCNVLRQD